MIPIGLDRPLKRPPVVSYALVIANVCAYLAIAEVLPGTHGIDPEAVVRDWAFSSDREPFSIWPFVTYMFVHPNVWLLVVNIVGFLLIGAAVEDKIGRVRMALVYIGGGMVVAFCHGIAMGGIQTAGAVPLVGASGTIALVMGIFCVATPWTNVRMAYFFMFWFRFFFSGTFLLPGLLFVPLYLLLLSRFDSVFLGAPHPGAYEVWFHFGAAGLGGAVAMLFYGLRELRDTPDAAREREREAEDELARSPHGEIPDARTMPLPPVVPEQQRVDSAPRPQPPRRLPSSRSVRFKAIEIEQHGAQPGDGEKGREPGGRIVEDLLTDPLMQLRPLRGSPPEEEAGSPEDDPPPVDDGTRWGPPE